MLATVRHADSKLKSLRSGTLKGKEPQVRALINALLTAGTRCQKHREAFIHPLLTGRLRGATPDTDWCRPMCSAPGTFIQYSLWRTEPRCRQAAPPQPRAASPRVTHPVLPWALLSLPRSPSSGLGSPAAPLLPPPRAHLAPRTRRGTETPSTAWRGAGNSPALVLLPGARRERGSPVQGAEVRSRCSRGWQRCAPALRESSAALSPIGGLPSRGGWRQQSDPCPPLPRSRTAKAHPATFPATTCWAAAGRRDGRREGEKEGELRPSP